MNALPRQSFNVKITDTWQTQKIEFKNYLINNPIIMGGGMGSEFLFGDFTPGAGYFTDINADVGTKQMKLFGRKLTRQRSGDPEEWTKGFIDFTFKCTLAGKTYLLPFHKFDLLYFLNQSFYFVYLMNSLILLNYHFDWSI